MGLKSRIVFQYFAFFISVFIISSYTERSEYAGWKIYGGSNFNIQYSALNEIDTNNVKKLQIVWIYHTNDAEASSQLEVVDGVLYGVSLKLKLFAMDAETGKEKWHFDPFADTVVFNHKRHDENICRGIAYYKGKENDNLIFYTAGSSLFCIDAKSGKPLMSFGNNGNTNFHNNLGRDISKFFVTSTSPAVIYKDFLIIGIAISEDANAAPGHIRAYDVHTGKLRWIFYTIPLYW